ncbi:hypothetical protein AXG93_2387s1000 [Marchantia polymorpha subsp. ruderalis]|uniref:Uncharacterized protein n=1 Tax=Marchantia polymorpha subsp. ruderalis TaxID=1480154 RepID=A0A176VXF2_MARPO|nr:hypothetical protein AXG93_2387s1000 [Marchantia polymorpha subsp. ruderalis]
MLNKRLAAIVSKVDALGKDFADLNVHVIAGQDQRKSPSRLRANILCITFGKIGHANTGCMATRSNYPMNSVEWVPVWEMGTYYVKTLEDAPYTVQEEHASTPIPPVHIPRPARKDHDDTWPEDKVLVGKVKTRSAIRRKDAPPTMSKRDKTRATVTPKAISLTPKTLRQKTSDPLA